MNLEDLKGLKYFLAYAVVVIGVFFYSGITGYRWFYSKETKEETSSSSSGTRSGRGYIMRHK